MGFIYRSLIAVLLLSMAARLSLSLLAEDFLAELSQGDWLIAMLQGLRYDFALWALISLPVLILISMPGAAALNRFTRYAGYILLALLVAAAMILGIASIQFLTFFNRHLGIEVQAIFSDFGFLLELAVAQHGVALFSVVIGLIFALYLASRWLPKLPSPDYGASAYGLRLLALLGASYFLVMGAPARELFDERHAFASNNVALANLTLNPAYSALNGLLFPPADYRSPKTVGSVASKVSPKTSREPPNIVLVILESWTPDFIGAFGAKNSITPEFDAIAAQGRRYQQAYANGPMSIYGLQAILTGQPHIPGMPLMGVNGIETSAHKGIAQIAGEQGYETFWAQAPKRASFNMDTLAQRWGFEHVAGKEQYQTPEDWVSTPFGWDWPMYQYALESIPKMQSPFLATLYTAVTHIPYVEVPPQHRRAEQNAEGVGGFINTLSRADWALGRFWGQAEQQPWHKNTVYIFVSDHVVPKFMPDKSTRGRFRIPLAVVGPNIANEDIDAITAQADILPVVRQLAQGHRLPPIEQPAVLLSNGQTSIWLNEQTVYRRYRQQTPTLDAGPVDESLEKSFP